MHRDAVPVRGQLPAFTCHSLETPATTISTAQDTHQDTGISESNLKQKVQTFYLRPNLLPTRMSSDISCCLCRKRSLDTFCHGVAFLYTEIGTPTCQVFLPHLISCPALISKIHFSYQAFCIVIVTFPGESFQACCFHV